MVIFSVPGTSVGLAQSILSDTSFTSLESRVCEPTLRAIVDMGFSHMTEIQAKSIPHLLEGRWVFFTVTLFHDYLGGGR